MFREHLLADPRHWLLRRHPVRHPPRGQAPGQGALRMARLPAPRRLVRHPSPAAQEGRRPDLHLELRVGVSVPPRRVHTPPRLATHPPPRRHHRLWPQRADHPQPRTAWRPRATRPALPMAMRPPAARESASLAGALACPRVARARGHDPQRSRSASAARVPASPLAPPAAASSPAAACRCGTRER
jgi:hypothetical protein